MSTCFSGGLSGQLRGRLVGQWQATWEGREGECARKAPSLVIPLLGVFSEGLTLIFLLHLIGLIRLRFLARFVSGNY